MKIKNILILILLFSLLFLPKTFALFEANISVNNNITDINDTIFLDIKINSDTGGELKFKKIEGIDNFDVVSQSEIQSNSTKVNVINGKSESINYINLNYRLELQGKAKGEFVLGPITIIKGNEKIQTNKIIIEVKGNKILSNSVDSNIIGGSINNLNNNNLNNIEKQLEDFSKGVEKKKFNDKTDYLLILLIIIIGIGIYLLLKNKKNNIQNNLNKEKDNEELNNNEKIDNIESLKANNNQNEIETIYPELDDYDFSNKINNIFRSKIKNVYNIKNIHSKTNKEILESINGDNKKEIQQIIRLLNKSKYSNTDFDKKTLLNLIKEL